MLVLQAYPRLPSHSNISAGWIGQSHPDGFRSLFFFRRSPWSQLELEEHLRMKGLITAWSRLDIGAAALSFISHDYSFTLSKPRKRWGDAWDLVTWIQQRQPSEPGLEAASPYGVLPCGSRSQKALSARAGTAMVLVCSHLASHREQISSTSEKQDLYQLSNRKPILVWPDVWREPQLCHSRQHAPPPWRIHFGNLEDGRL